MKEKIYDPARHNETAPAEGMAAVNTHMPEETPLEELQSDPNKIPQAHPQQNKEQAEEAEGQQ